MKQPALPLSDNDLISLVRSFNLILPDAWVSIQNMVNDRSEKELRIFKQKLFDAFDKNFGIYLTEYDIPLGDEVYKISYEDSIFTITYKGSTVFTC